MTAGRFDPVSLAELRARTADALDELRELRSHDPAAAGAMRALRLTRHTLEWFWIPALDELGSTARTEPV
jgi:hypothetical protein